MWPDPLVQAFYDTNIAQAAFFPNITLSGALGWTTGSVKVDPASLISNLVGSLTQPIFGRGANKARLEAAKKRVELDKKQILNLQASVWNTQLLMKHGNANYLEVLTAQKNLLQVELSEVSDRYDEIQAVINLYQALGGGY